MCRLRPQSDVAQLGGLTSSLIGLIQGSNNKVLLRVLLRRMSQLFEMREKESTVEPKRIQSNCKDTNRAFRSAADATGTRIRSRPFIETIMIIRLIRLKDKIIPGDVCRIDYSGVPTNPDVDLLCEWVATINSSRRCPTVLNLVIACPASRHPRKNVSWPSRNAPRKTALVAII